MLLEEGIQTLRNINKISPELRERLATLNSREVINLFDNRDDNVTLMYFDCPKGEIRSALNDCGFFFTEVESGFCFENQGYGNICVFLTDPTPYFAFKNFYQKDIIFYNTVSRRNFYMDLEKYPVSFFIFLLFSLTEYTNIAVDTEDNPFFSSIWTNNIYPKEVYIPERNIIFDIKPNKIDPNKIPPKLFLAALKHALGKQLPAVWFRNCQKFGILEHFMPELTAGIGCYQNPEYNKEDVFDHSLRTLDGMASFSNDMDLKLAALLHDCGKPFTKQIIED